MISRWVSWYTKRGLEALLPKKRAAHRRNMSYEEEKRLLMAFDELAQAGQVVEVRDSCGPVI